MAQVDPKTLEVKDLKSLILDEQDKVEIASRNVQILRSELNSRPRVTNMVEEVEKVSADENVAPVEVPKDEPKPEEKVEEKPVEEPKQ
uniref:Uncharacterized protein n=1 Tax=viral metagenome TaxID=1070528 RepID=A0A6M3LAD5_9ZZZZ